jgi:lipoprotein NlpI
MGLGRQAAADSLAYLTRRGWSDDSAPYAALTAYFGYRKDKREDEAAKLIEEMSSKLDANAWPYPVIKYLDRQMTAQQLISSARGRDELTEARAYAGMDLSLGGNRDEAVVHLRWVKEKGEQGPGQYAMALGELRRLESDVGGKAR